ncbi:hypothetical protein RIF29_35893 [Crotalaria pallida]|uniref:DUF4283 domain-containing protein n=1 Tax=Crotalaria pallida TaxID=3830 RepID=A0AAN9HUA2_CROPI
MRGRIEARSIDRKGGTRLSFGVEDKGERPQDHWRRALLRRGGIVSNPITPHLVGMVYKCKKETLERLSACYVGEVRKLENVKYMWELLQKEGFFTIKSTPMGGKPVLLEGQNTEEVKELLRSEEEWFSSVFSDVRRWTPKDLAKERFVWIRCFGVPPQAWDEAFFRLIANKWGTLLELEKKTLTRERLDIESFLLATSYKAKIYDVVQVKVHGLLVEVRVMEDPLETLG